MVTVGKDGWQPFGDQRVRLEVLAWAGWLPGGDVMLGNGLAPDRTAPPANLRRRVTRAGRKALEAAWAVLAGRSGHPRIVLSSRHGEFSRSLALQQALATEGEVSPAEFSLSVHHGLGALLSIATGNRAAHTAVAAGADSFGYGCIEAAAGLAEAGGNVLLLLHFDEALPESHGAIADGLGEEIALALLLGPGGMPVAMDFAPAKPGAPGACAHDFLRMLAGTDGQARARGDRMEWSWHRVA